MYDWCRQAAWWHFEVKDDYYGLKEEVVKVGPQETG